MSIFALLITVNLVILPILVNALLHKLLNRPFLFDVGKVLLPLISGIVYVVARALPEPHITKESITLLQHFVGGGFVSTLYFIYFIRELKVKLPTLAYIALLYPFVSMMGVTNELLEFTSTKLGIYAVDGTDTWWDLTANTLGAYSLLLGALLIAKLWKMSLVEDKK